MAAPIGTWSFPKASVPGVKSWFGIGYGEHVEEHKSLFDMGMSTRAFEEDVMIPSFGLMNAKTQGGSTTYQDHTQGPVSRYTHTAFSTGFIVTFEEYLTNQYEKVANSRSKAMGFSKRQTIETLAALVYNRAFNSSYIGGDGKELLATDHPNAGAGTFSNELNPSVDISEAALEDLCYQVMTAIDYKGNKIALMVQTLLVHPANWFEANRILKSTLQNENSSNAINVLKSTNAIPGGIKMNHYFSDSDAFFARTNVPDGMKGYVMHSYDVKKDNDFDTDNQKFKTYWYGSFGWSDILGLFGSAGG